MQGQLGEKLIPDLIREIAQRGQSGLLRLTRGRSIKAIFFESGKPVFAISNLATEQLENNLIHQGLATPQQIEQAKARAGKTNRIATALVEMGVLSDAVMRKIVRQQVMDIIRSLFEWSQGDYHLDERIRAAHEVTIDIGVADVLLEGMRHAAKIQQIAERIAPKDATVARAKNNGLQIDSGRLLPVESYVLSRIEHQCMVSEVGALSGIADEEAHVAVCSLVAAGFLKVVDKNKSQEEEQNRESDEDLEQLRREISRKISFFASADYYDMLGVGRQATTAEIKTAYYQLAKKFHPDRYRQPEHSDLRSKLEALFTLITQAYDTLSEPAHRAAYDERLRKSPPSSAPTSLKTTPLVNVEPPKTEPVASAEERLPSGDLNPQASQQRTTGSLSQPHAEHISAEAHSPKPASNVPPAQQAEHYYKQGRALFDRKEYHAAVHLLREAVKLDPSRAPYHFHLGLALIRNPRTRREAIEHLTKAAELEPYNAQIRVKMGLIYKEAGLAKKAESYFREALSLDPDNRVAKRELGDQAAKAESVSIWKSDLGSIAKRLFKK
ncbi:MAG TPA: DUF4388 domain-containing protein [Blastocatellia bacterium]|nr:DUF4388 domain-containing protein [Blastocatellia bacterium]